jgi:DNA repair exonuclease SbcCD ATPase subunit
MVSLYRTHRVENRADAQSVIEEWREIHSRDEERIGQLIASVELLNAKVEALQREHMSCEIRCSQMAAKITLLESAIHAAGNKPPAAT